MPNYLDIEVGLDGVTPRIWRRFLLRERANFLDLHHAVQDACGWQDAHLFAFRDANGAVIAGVPDNFGFGPPDPDAAKVRTAAYLKRHWSVSYEYDYGDSWQHSLELKQVVALEERFTRRLLGGARAFPPEDCGGLPGYEDVVAVAAGGQATYHDTAALREWCAGWDPEFSISKPCAHRSTGKPHGPRSRLPSAGPTGPSAPGRARRAERAGQTTLRAAGDKQPNHTSWSRYCIFLS